MLKFYAVLHEKKAVMTSHFLKHKKYHFNALKLEVATLKWEIEADNGEMSRDQ